MGLLEEKTWNSKRVLCLGGITSSTEVIRWLIPHWGGLLRLMAGAAMTAVEADGLVLIEAAGSLSAVEAGGCSCD